MKTPYKQPLQIDTRARLGLPLSSNVRKTPAWRGFLIMAIVLVAFWVHFGFFLVHCFSNR